MDWNFKFDDESQQMVSSTFYLSIFRIAMFSWKTMDLLQKFACIMCNMPLRLPVLSATEPELRDHLY